MLSPHKKIIVACLISLLVFGLVIISAALARLNPAYNFAEAIDLKVTGWLFNLRGEQAADPEIVIVAIDEYAFENLQKRWPWSPALHARLVDSLAHWGARVIAFDIAFSESSEDLYPGSDSVFAAAIARAGNVIIPAKFERLLNPVSGDPELKFTPQVRLIREQCYATGITNIAAEIDGTVQRFPYPAAFSFQDTQYPGFALAAVGAYLRLHPQRELGSLLRRLQLEPPYQNRTLINYAGPAFTYPVISYHHIINGSIAAAQVRDKIVLIGATILEMHDYKPTPFSSQQRPQMAGIEIHANIAATLLRQRYIATLSPGMRLLLALLLALGSALLFMFLRPSAGAFAALLLLAGYWALAMYQFNHAGFLLPLSPLLLAVPPVFLLSTFYKHKTEAQERRRVKKLFSRYLSSQIVNELLKNPELLKLGGKRTRATLLFSDIRGFTSMSASMPPEEVVSILNTYFDVMTRIVLKYDGMLDKYMGDGLMAAFGIPLPRKDDAERAVRAALEMQEALKSLNTHLKAKLPRPLQIGIGINTGEVIAGNIGSELHTEYTVIGDPVNVSSRLESLTKTLGATIVISAETCREVEDQFFMRDLGTHTLRGKSAPIRLYQVLLEKNSENPKLTEKEFTDAM